MSSKGPLRSSFSPGDLVREVRRQAAILRGMVRRAEEGGWTSTSAEKKELTRRAAMLEAAAEVLSRPWPPPPPKEAEVTPGAPAADP